MSSNSVLEPGAGARGFLSPASTGADPEGRIKVYLHPGQFFCSSQPAVISCMLGSCVAVCLWDRKLKVGGAVHFLLPGDSDAHSHKAGSWGIKDLISKLRAYGATPDGLVAKVFGGACVLQELNQIQIGTRNIETARACLKTEGILVVAQDVGGQRGRKVVFLTDTGDVTVKTV